MTEMTYEEVVQRLYNCKLHGGMKLGLDNIERLCAALGHPERAFPSVHIAGTNGKGSVAWMSAVGLQHSGQRVGLFTSPHICTFRERIRVNGEAISEQMVQQIVARLFFICEQEDIPATFFELTTALALVYFAQQEVDVAVMEVGMGGRLDATNVVRPSITAITSIGLDHTEFLGDSLEAIALEKAGIMKVGVPVVIGSEVPACVERLAEELGCPFQRVPFVEGWQEQNQEVAAALLRSLGVKKNSLDFALKQKPPCRFEKLTCGSVPVILDVAHNLAGFEAVFQKLAGERVRVVLGLSQGKDAIACLGFLRDRVTHFHLVPSSVERGVPVEALTGGLLAMGCLEHSPYEDVESACLEALVMAEANNETLLIIGSFFLMAEARATLGLGGEKDLLDLNAFSMEVPGSS